MTEEPKASFWARCGDTTPRDRRNQTRMLVTLAVWAVCFVGASYSIKHELLTDGILAWLVAAAPTVVGLFVLLAYARFLREADELQRLIQLQALALGFGAGWLAISGYPIFERLGAPAADPGDFIFVMAIFYSLGSVAGVWRYR